MKKLTLVSVQSACLSVILSLSACVTEEVPLKQAPVVPQSSVIAVSDPDIALNQEHLLSWFPQDFMVVEGQDVSAAHLKSYAYIKQRIKMTLEAKGLKFAAKGVEGSRQVVVAALLGEGKNSTSIERLFKLYPNLTAQDDIKTGTLLIAIIDPQQYKAAWRGAIQILIEEGVSESQRHIRIDSAVARLLRSLDV